MRAKTEGGFDYRKIDGGTSSEQPKTNNEKKGDGVSSSIPSAFSSYTTRSKRLREKMEGGSNDIKRDGGTSSEKPKTNNEKKSDGLSLSRPGDFSSSSTRSELLRDKIEGGSNDRKIDGGTSSDQTNENNENKGDGVSSSMPSDFSLSTT